MSDQGKIFTEAAGRRISAAVKWVEQHRGERPAASPPAAPGVDPVYVRTTSGTADGDGNYPGVVCLYSASAAAWQEYSAVKLRPANGEALANNIRYPARPSGRTTAGDELYTVHQTPQVQILHNGPIDLGPDTTPLDTAAKKIEFLTGYSYSGGVGVDCGLRAYEYAPGWVVVYLQEANGLMPGAVTTAEQTWNGKKWFGGNVGIVRDTYIEFPGILTPAVDIPAGRKVRAIAESDGLNIRAYAGLGYGDMGAAIKLSTNGPNRRGEILLVGYDTAGDPVRPTISVYASGGLYLTGGTGTVNGMDFSSGLYVGGTGETGLTGTVP